MYDILREHALTHMWAESVQDRQYIIKPSRLTSRQGAHKVATVMWEGVRLPNYDNPTDPTTYHVYSLGQLPPWLFALEMNPLQWYRVDQLGVENTVVVDVYADNGALIPHSLAYLYQNYDNSFILAVPRVSFDLGTFRKEDQYGDFNIIPYTLDEHGITVRFYSNAIIQSDAWREEVPNPQAPLKEVFKRINSASDYASFVQECTSINNSYDGKGKGICYNEGFMVGSSFSGGYLPEYNGRLLTYRYDETIREIISFPIRELPGFKSTLDRKTDKYLLVQPVDHEHIDFHDDVDFYLCKRENGKIKGVMLDRLHASAVRQVTHNAWSIKADNVIRLTSEHDFLNLIDALEIVAVIRNGGMMHNLGYQSIRLEELYHLPTSEVIEAMALTESNVKFWQAPELEQSAYIRLMSSKAKQITTDLVDEAYGYHAATKAVQRSLVKLTDGGLNVDPAFMLPTTLKDNADNTKADRVVFWYDSSGKLIGYQEDKTTSARITPNANIADPYYAEIFQGKLSLMGDSDGTFLDKETIVDDSYGFFGHRNYVCNIVNGTHDNNWVDVTGSKYVNYIPATNTSPPLIKWNYTLLDAANLLPCTRIASKIGLATFSFDAANRSGAFSVQLMVNVGDKFAPIAGIPGHVDVFMNGKLLIIDLDYYYDKNGSVIITKQVDAGVDIANIIIRWYGYGHPKLNRVHPSRDKGFVKNGRISHNGVFNPIHDRVVRITIGGRLYTFDEISIAEQAGGLAILDGKPYSVDDYQPLVEAYTNRHTVDYQLEALERDEVVSNYLTTRLPEQPVDNNYISIEKWELYSPAMAGIIDLMVTGMINDDLINTWDGEKSLFNNVKPYIDTYKECDPCIVGFDPDFCKVEPYPFKTVLNVSALQYATLERINKELLNNTVDLTNYLKIH